MTTDVFRALGDPLRQRIVERLTQGPATPSELRGLQDITLTGLLKHLTVLERAGVVERRKVGREVTCTLRTEPLDMAQRWLHDRVDYWSRTLDRLDDLVTEPHVKEHP